MPHERTDQAIQREIDRTAEALSRNEIERGPLPNGFDPWARINILHLVPKPKRKKKT